MSGISKRPIVPPTDFPAERRLTPLRQPQLYEQVVQQILGELRSGALLPGDRLPSERELARQLEISRSSVREAVAALQNEGILETRPGAGSFVAHDALTNVPVRLTGATGTLGADVSPSSLLEARVTFEPNIARLAALRGQPDAVVEELLRSMDELVVADGREARAAWHDADRLFHRQLAVMTANPILETMADYVAEVMDEPLWRRLRDDIIAVPDRTALFAADHRMIYDAIVSGDGDAAEFLAAHHLKRVRHDMTLD